jgi:hypothetical protein
VQAAAGVFVHGKHPMIRAGSPVITELKHTGVETPTPTAAGATLIKENAASVTASTATTAAEVADTTNTTASAAPLINLSNTVLKAPTPTSPLKPAQLLQQQHK